MKHIINRLTFIALSALGLLFMAAVFVIGIVAFWYILLLGLIVLTIRRIQLFFKTRRTVEPPPQQPQQSRSHAPHKGRIIEHED